MGNGTNIQTEVGWIWRGRRRSGLKPPQYKRRERLALPYVLAATSSLTPRSAPEIFQIVWNDYGSICDRQLYRLLAWLVMAKLVVKLKPGAYVRAHGVTVDVYADDENR